MFLKTRHILTVLSAMALCACGGKADTEIPVAGVEVNPAQVTLLLDQTTVLTATLTPSNATGAVVEWTSDNPIIAAVSPDGLVTAVSLGQTTVHAVAGGKRGSCVVTVSPKQVESVTVSPSSLTLTSGQSQTLQANVMPEDATDRSVTWSSSDPSVATVDQTGAVTALKAGNVSIVAESVNGIKGECALVCKAPFSFGVEYYDPSSSSWKNAADGLAGYPGLQVQVRLAVIEGDGITFGWTVQGEHASYAADVVTLLTPGQAVVKVEASDGQSVEVPVTVNLSDTFLWGSDAFAYGSLIPTGNTAGQTVALTWQSPDGASPLPADAYTIYSESQLVAITKTESGYTVTAQGEQGDAPVRMKIDGIMDELLCTVRVSGKWSSGNENLDEEQTFPW